ncbi:AvrD family protein [Streptomyces sp. NBC_00989]|uniref:AvrD family protein n=1 Tax=Streptomyces sp. NBC_00989 TaxID=2903705 RepID=UPI00386C6FBA|nr:AvrD family protein [Streptomyces sp. NBC_00989]WSW98046.1 AvrD family protein [Streptomyces sp. NBC_00989]
MSSLHLASIDDFLGPREGRFLGEGFKRVAHSLTDLTITPATTTPGTTVTPGTAGGGAGIRATAHLALPAAWSRKGDRYPTPHLSSLDVMLFAARLTGLYAAHACSPAPGDLFEVCRVDIRAGSRPDEEGLESFPVTGRLVAAETAGPVWSTTLDCRIGSLSARVQARHGPGRRPPGPPRSYYLAEELPGPWNDAPYGVPHGGRRQLLTGVRVEDGAGEDPRASARVALVGDGTQPALDDAPATMIDAFVAAMQLGQVLLYTLDGVERADSNNLWMRRTRITAGTGAAEGTGGEVTARLERARLLRSPSGTWRTAEVDGALHGVRAWASVAHLLTSPSPSTSRAEHGR